MNFRRSFDFENAVEALSWLFRVFNPGSFGPFCDQSGTGSARRAVCPEGAVRPDSATDALFKFTQNMRVTCDAALASSIVETYAAGELKRASDGKIPPRCVVALLLWRLGQREFILRIWELPPTDAMYCSELEGFEAWFSIAMSTRPWPGRVRTKRGGRRCAKLRRDDAIARGRAHCPSVGAEWAATQVNQQRPIVANALLASSAAKALLEKTLGPGATSLGSTGVERGWWLHHVHNANKTGVWTTNAGRQFRAVVIWKRQVRASLRRRQAHVAGTRGSGSGQQAQALAEECDVLAEHLAGRARGQLLLAAGESQPEDPGAANVNIGLDKFRLQLQETGVEHW